MLGEAHEHNVSGITAFTYEGQGCVGLKKDGVAYAASEESVTLVLEYTGSQTNTQEHYSPQYTANNAIFYSGWNSISLLLDTSNDDIVINFIGFTLTFEGMGSESEPYEIHCIEQWNLLAYHVNLGIRLYIEKYFKLMTDLTIEETFSGFPTTQIGADELDCFSGIFDGNGHTITINYTDNSSHHYCAPFRIIKGATIKNLHVAGSIIKKGDGKHTAGIVGKAINICHIIDCHSSVEIIYDDGGDCSSGGLVGDVRPFDQHPQTTIIYLTNCVFDGILRSLEEPIATCWGGLVGWVNSAADAYFDNCLFAPVKLDTRIGGYHDEDSRTLARGDGDLYFTNCYYSTFIGGDQGELALSITPGEYVAIEFAGTPSTTSTVGTIGYGTGIKYNNTLYAANGENVSLHLSDTPNPGYVSGSYVTSAGTLSGTENPYTLTMPNEDVTISLTAAEWEGTGTENDPYLIYVFSQWDLLASRVNNPGTNEEAQQGYSGKFFKLMDDISITSMVGNSAHSFKGTFDGNGHTMTVTLNSYESYAAPFRYVNGVTIKHLHIVGEIGLARSILDTSSQIKFAGVVGRSSGTCNFIDCRSSITIGTKEIYFGYQPEYQCGLGGFMGEVVSGTVNMDRCVFDGRMIILRQVAIGWGGFIGMVKNGARAIITNSLFAPKEVQLTDFTGSMTFARRENSNGVTTTNSYYTRTLGTVQGKQARSITAGSEDIMVAFAGVRGQQHHHLRQQPWLTPLRQYQLHPHRRQWRGREPQSHGSGRLCHQQCYIYP